MRVVHASRQLSFGRDAWDTVSVSSSVWDSTVVGKAVRKSAFTGIESVARTTCRLGFVSVIWHRWVQGCSVQERGSGASAE